VIWGECDIAVLKGSARGIQGMIEGRLRDIHHMLSYYNGNELKFIKPPQDKTSIERKCLQLRREVKRLRVIKAEINLIIQLKELHYA
jgi:hypothetical protein